MSRRYSWGSQFAFYMATIAAACGLGNIWRFPTVVNKNGGGAVVFLYIAFSFLLGLPVLVSELLLGKTTRTSVIHAVREVVQNHRSKQVGWISFLCSLLVISYYSVVSGWVIFYIVRFSVVLLGFSTVTDESLWLVLKDSGVLQILLTSVHLILVGLVVGKGLKEGLEKVVGWIMPLFLVLLITLAVQSLSLDAASEALRYLFYPDFSQIRGYTFLQVMGHVFFTLSIGVGMLVTFGSYMKDETHIPTVGFRVTMLDVVVSIFSLLLIFPIVFQSEIHIAGPELMFRSFTLLFQKMDWGALFGLSFFVCLYMAALAASISLYEVGVANWVDVKKTTRRTASFWFGVTCFVLSLLPALSTSVFKNFKLFGLSLLELMDQVVVVWLLPISALVISVIVVHRSNKEEVEREFYDPDSLGSERLYGDWIVVSKYWVPGAILLFILLALWDFLI